MDKGRHLGKRFISSLSNNVVGFFLGKSETSSSLKMDASSMDLVLRFVNAALADDWGNCKASDLEIIKFP